MSMLLPKEIRVVDRAYRQSARDRMCENCGAPAAVGAHPRAGHAAGVGNKPTDAYLLFLCYACHGEQETAGLPWLARFTMTVLLNLPWPGEDKPTDMECLWIVKWIMRPLLVRRYERWKMNCPTGQQNG
jgi:hypothetical protein